MSSLKNRTPKKLKKIKASKNMSNRRLKKRKKRRKFRTTYRKNKKKKHIKNTTMKLRKKIVSMNKAYNRIRKKILKRIRNEYKTKGGADPLPPTALEEDPPSSGDEKEPPAPGRHRRNNPVVRPQRPVTPQIGDSKETAKDDEGSKTPTPRSSSLSPPTPTSTPTPTPSAPPLDNNGGSEDSNTNWQCPICNDFTEISQNSCNTDKCPGVRPKPGFWQCNVCYKFMKNDKLKCTTKTGIMRKKCTGRNPNSTTIKSNANVEKLEKRVAQLEAALKIRSTKTIDDDDDDVDDAPPEEVSDDEEPGEQNDDSKKGKKEENKKGENINPNMLSKKGLHRPYIDYHTKFDVVTSTSINNDSNNYDKDRNEALNPDKKKRSSASGSKTIDDSDSDDSSESSDSESEEEGEGDEDEESEKIDQFINFTASDRKTAKKYLEASGGKLEIAINKFLKDNEGKDTGSKDKSAGEEKGKESTQKDKMRKLFEMREKLGEEVFFAEIVKLKEKGGGDFETNYNELHKELWKSGDVSFDNTQISKYEGLMGEYITTETKDLNFYKKYWYFNYDTSEEVVEGRLHYPNVTTISDSLVPAVSVEEEID